MAITYPVRSEGRTAFRRVIEAIAQEVPLTGALAHLYGYTHPTLFERDIESFQRQLATSANDHEERITLLEAILAPRAAMSPLALDVAFHILREDDSGCWYAVEFQELWATFPEAQEDELEEAVAELCHLGYATYEFVTVRPTVAMYLAFDLVATGRNTRSDAVEIARLWLEDEQFSNVALLEQHLGWELRRLNPALEALHHIFPYGRWSEELQPRFATIGVLITVDERFQLRRIVQSEQVD